MNCQTCNCDFGTAYEDLSAGAFFCPECAATYEHVPGRAPVPFSAEAINRLSDAQLQLLVAGLKEAVEFALLRMGVRYTQQGRPADVTEGDQVDNVLGGFLLTVGLEYTKSPFHAQQYHASADRVAAHPVAVRYALLSKWGLWFARSLAHPLENQYDRSRTVFAAAASPQADPLAAHGALRPRRAPPAGRPRRRPV